MPVELWLLLVNSFEPYHFDDHQELSCMQNPAMLTAVTLFSGGESGST